MRRHVIPIVLASAFLGGCAEHHKPSTTQGTLAELRNVAPDVQEVKTSRAWIRPCSSTGGFSRKHRRPR